MRIKAITFLLGAALSPIAASASDYPNQPVYDCNREETLLYVNQLTSTVFTPNAMTSPKAFEAAVVTQSEEAKAQGDLGGSSCVTVFSDGKLSDEWKRIVETIKTIDFSPDFSSINGAAMQAFLDGAKERIMEEVNGAIAALGQDICEMMSSDNLEDLILDGIHSSTGLNPGRLRMDSFVDELTEEMLLRADRDIVKLVSDEDALADWMGGETRQELREARRELWENF